MSNLVKSARGTQRRNMTERVKSAQINEKYEELARLWRKYIRPYWDGVEEFDQLRFVREELPTAAQRSEARKVKRRLARRKKAGFKIDPKTQTNEKYEKLVRRWRKYVWPYWEGVSEFDQLHFVMEEPRTAAQRSEEKKVKKWLPPRKKTGVT